MMARAPLLTGIMAASFLLAAALAPVAGQAADEPPPHRTVVRHHHTRTNTGDAQVDRLNESQLDANYRGSWHYMNGPPGSPPPPTPYGPPPPLPGANAPPPRPLVPHR